MHKRQPKKKKLYNDLLYFRSHIPSTLVATPQLATLQLSKSSQSKRSSKGQLEGYVVLHG
jgi:hypothetical protein